MYFMYLGAAFATSEAQASFLQAWTKLFVQKQVFYFLLIPGGSAPRPPFGRPSASEMSAFGLQNVGLRPPNGSPNGIQMGPK